MTKAIQTEEVCKHKTKPQFRKTFTRVYKSKQAHTKDTGFNNNRKRYRESSNINTSDNHYVLNGKNRKYNTDHTIPSKINTNRNLISPTNREQKSNKKRWLKLL